MTRDLQGTYLDGPKDGQKFWTRRRHRRRYPMTEGCYMLAKRGLFLSPHGTFYFDLVYVWFRQKDLESVT